MHPLLLTLICLTSFRLLHADIDSFEEIDPEEEVTEEVVVEEEEIDDDNDFAFEEVELDQAQEGLMNLDSARQSQIEAQRSERGDHSNTMADEEDRFGKVTASPNSPNLTERGKEEPVVENEITFEEMGLDNPEGGDSSFTDDVDLDEPTPIYVPPAPPPIPADPSVSAKELIIDLRNPVFSHGVITTHDGGVITGQGLRIQGQHIEYTNKVENGQKVQKIVAEGDLLLEYGNRAFVGTRLEYDFAQKTGTLLHGKTFVNVWFLGGDKIELKPDGSFYISNAFVTTCEDQDNTWEINAKKVHITKDSLLSAKNIKLKFFKIPLFWFPAFKSNLKVFTDTPIRYKVVWDKGLGPRLTMRYRALSWNDLNLFLRLDYRLQRGLGGAVETEYVSPDNLTTFVTRSYGAYDKSFPDERGPRRYRLQGLYHTETKDERTQVHLTWDKLSDSRMVGDFRSSDFEINTQKRTHLLVMHQLDSTFFNFAVQPRLNRFQSIDQELPLLTIGIRPFQLGNSGIMSNNYVSTGYLDYVYATDLRNQFHLRHLQSSTHSFRMETHNELYRPFHWGHFTLTPNVGVIGIFYSNNPSHHPIGQGIFSYGFQGLTRFYRNYSHFRHLAEPYLEFQGLTSPTAGLSRHYYFDINDGYDQLNQLRIGVRNSFFAFKQSCFLPSLFTDIYTFGFFGRRHFAQSFPKYYFTAGWSRPSYAIRAGVAWNNEEKLWDYTNVATDWTITEDIALGLEFRHRSKYDWRKANHQNFIVDVARPIDELLRSPLSDGRDTVLTRFFVRLAPKWSFQIQSRHGWGRKNEPRYNAGKFDLYTMLTCSWRLRLSYERMPNDNRFSGSISLVR